MSIQPLGHRAAVALSILALAGVPASAQRRGTTTAWLDGFDAYVTTAMSQWKVPGLAVAAIRGDSIVFAKGYGVRTIGEPGPVDPETIFAVGSTTKAFTAAALGILADEGRVDFTGRVVDYLPWFALEDPWITRELRIADLLTHRSGAGRGDQIFYGSTASREDVVRSLRHLPFTAPLRTRFQYNNLMFITAGEVVHAVVGASWDQFVTDRLLAPLGMRRATTSVRDLVGRPNVATPHAELGGAVRPIAYRNIDAAAASGGINTNVLEMASWVRLWLNHGRHGGRQILSGRYVREAMRTQFAVDDPYFFARLQSPAFLGYGYGWFVQDFRGRRRISHGGNIDGMAAMVGFLPEDSVGVVVLTNMNQSDITIPLMSNLFDRLLGVDPPRDYNAEYRATADSAEKSMRAARREPARTLGTRPSLELSAYVGSYRHPFMGQATVTLDRDRLVIRYEPAPTVTGPLEHWHYDTFVAKLVDPIFGQARVTFRLDASGRVSGMVFSHGGFDDDWQRH